MRNAQCRELLAQISAYLDGELGAVACAAIEEHCAGCGECAGVIEDLKKTMALCRDAGQAPLPADVRDRARASIKQLLDST
jgi:anti-sigma factor RsiW